MEILDKYNKELENDTKVDEMNIKDVQMKLPSIKHKWVARLIFHKNEIRKLYSLKNKAKEEIIKKCSDTQEIQMSHIAIEKKAETHDTIKKINSKIEEESLIVLYLEKVEVVLKNMTYDIKNIIDVMKMETL